MALFLFLFLEGITRDAFAFWFLRTLPVSPVLVACVHFPLQQVSVCIVCTLFLIRKAACSQFITAPVCEFVSLPPHDV